jgi:hypothetical protein
VGSAPFHDWATESWLLHDTFISVCLNLHILSLDASVSPMEDPEVGYCDRGADLDVTWDRQIEAGLGYSRLEMWNIFNHLKTKDKSFAVYRLSTYMDIVYLSEFPYLLIECGPHIFSHDKSDLEFSLLLPTRTLHPLASVETLKACFSTICERGSYSALQTWGCYLY